MPAPCPQHVMTGILPNRRMFGTISSIEALSRRSEDVVRRSKETVACSRTFLGLKLIVDLSKPVRRSQETCPVPIVQMIVARTVHHRSPETCPPRPPLVPGDLAEERSAHTRGWTCRPMVLQHQNFCKASKQLRRSCNLHTLRHTENPSLWVNESKLNVEKYK